MENKCNNCNSSNIKSEEVSFRKGPVVFGGRGGGLTIINEDIYSCNECGSVFKLIKK
jgi:uncharacterized Zn finger protein